jgi:aminoglycoside/choline kinase family phosphotransferase
MSTPNDFDPRLTLLTAWLAEALGRAPERVAPASADASFRRYFRAFSGGRTWVAMDAPPEREDLAPYLRVATLLAAQGVHVPAVLAQDAQNGFLLLSDLGSLQLLEALKTGADPARMYSDAIAMLIRLQRTPLAAAADLPRYDAAQLRREMMLLPEWFIARHLGVTLTPAEEGVVLAAFGFLERAALVQPVVLVHRDYHSRNLMVLGADNPGVLDFQDAVVGPVSYDLVSLLKDCYLRWPRERVLGWVDEYRRLAAQAGIAGPADRAEFIRDFDLMGLQRHLKVLGIFARLWYRDGKPGYLRDLPRVLEYALEVTGAFAELADLDGLFRARLVPAFEAAQARALAAA